MAYDFRSKQPGGLTETERALLQDVSKIESVLRGHCFEGLNFLKRAATKVAIVVAARAVSGITPNIELKEHGWTLCDDATCSALPTQVPAAHEEGAPSEEWPSFEQLLSRSYSRDYVSYQARVALRRRSPEATDNYCDGPDEDEDGYFPELVAFRQRSAFSLQRV